jgi:hypothetical protein
LPFDVRAVRTESSPESGAVRRYRDTAFAGRDTVWSDAAISFAASARLLENIEPRPVLRVTPREAIDATAAISVRTF